MAERRIEVQMAAVNAAETAAAIGQSTEAVKGLNEAQKESADKSDDAATAIRPRRLGRFIPVPDDPFRIGYLDDGTPIYGWDDGKPILTPPAPEPPPVGDPAPEP